MATTITIDASSVPMGRDHVPRRLNRPIAGIDTYTFESRGGVNPVPDPKVGKEITVTVDGTLRFTGDVERVDYSWRAGIGNVRTYTCFGLRARGDWVGHVDSNTGGQSSTYNAARDLDFVDYLPSRAGREVGEIFLDVLTMQANADALDALGIGAYVSLSPPTLPSATLADLAAMDRVLPGPIRIGGERLLTSIESAVPIVAPNHRLHVEPDGTLRFLDLTAFDPITLTMGTDPVSPPDLSRDVSECFTAVVVKGQPLAIAAPFALSLGTLDETHFPYGAYDAAGAKAAFDPDDYFQPACADEGSCVCNTTTTITVTSDDATVAWVDNFWNHSSGGRYGSIQLIDSVGTTIAMVDHRLSVDSTAMTAGGTSVITVDRNLPHLDFDRYMLKGRRGGAQNVYTVYGLPSWAGPKVAPIAAFPYPLRNASGGGVMMTSTAMGQVLWSATGSPPFYEVALPVEVDPDAGVVIFPSPTWMMAGNREPSDVRAFIPIYNDVNSVRKPASGFEGEAYSVEGLEKVLTVFAPSWRDPANLTGMTDYAQDLLDSVKGPIVEGTVVHYGLNNDLLDAGISLVIESVDATTPWEGAAGLPVIETQLEWGTSPGAPTSHVISLRASTRRAAFTEAAFLAPDRTGVTLDFGGTLNLSGLKAYDPNALLGSMLNSYGDALAANASAAEAALAATAAADPIGDAFRETSAFLGGQRDQLDQFLGGQQAAADAFVPRGRGDGKIKEAKATGPAPVIGDPAPDEMSRAAARQAESRRRDAAVGDHLAANQEGQAQGKDRRFGFDPAEEAKKAAARQAESRAKAEADRREGAEIARRNAEEARRRREQRFVGNDDDEGGTTS